VAHDWGGAVAWNLAAGHPALMKKLAIINSPHPGTFLRELQHSPAQQAASAYMNFLIRPDAEALLAEDDFRRLWDFFTNMGAVDGPHAWLTDAVKDQYREIWRQGLTGPCNYYRASPLRPPRHGPPHNDPAAAAVSIPREMLEIHLPTLVLWALDDTALPPALLEGLDDYVPQMDLRRIEGATHWIVHEQPALVAAHLQDFLR
jgi:pimeloyl-ACP methyl ester carboxylesterase